MWKEQDTISSLINVFKNENYKLQYSVRNFRIDLYFLDYRLAIECDENNHCNYNKKKELERELFIKKELNCEFIRYNPDDKNFDIFELIKRIYEYIKKEKNKNLDKSFYKTNKNQNQLF